MSDHKRVELLEGRLEQLVRDVRALHEPAGQPVEVETECDVSEECDGHVEQVLVCRSCSPGDAVEIDPFSASAWITPWPCPTWLATQGVLDHRRHYTVTLTVADESGTIVATGSRRLSIDAGSDPVRAVVELGDVGGMLAGQQQRDR